MFSNWFVVVVSADLPDSTIATHDQVNENNIGSWCSKFMTLHLSAQADDLHLHTVSVVSVQHHPSLCLCGDILARCLVSFAWGTSTCADNSGLREIDGDECFRQGVYLVFFGSASVGRNGVNFVPQEKLEVLV